MTDEGGAKIIIVIVVFCHLKELSLSFERLVFDGQACTSDFVGMKHDRNDTNKFRIARLDTQRQVVLWYGAVSLSLCLCRKDKKRINKVRIFKPGIHVPMACYLSRSYFCEQS